MAACSFTLQHAGTPETLFPVVQHELSKSGGSIQGSPTAGSISTPTPAGDVTLNYKARGSSIAVTVLDKPMLVSCARIQSGLLELLAHVPPPTPIDVPGESGPALASYHVTELPPIEILGDPGTQHALAKPDFSKWLLAAGVGLAALGTTYVLAQKPKRRRTARYSRRTRA